MNGIPVGRLLGFEIRIHASWILILALITVLVVGQIEQSDPEVAAPLRWLVSGVIAGAFLVSVLAHELGHAVAARRRGLTTGPITLYFFGGSASVEVEPRRARDEAAIALAGPAVSLLVGGVLTGVALLAHESSSLEIRAAGVVAFILGVLNLLLGLVNLVPGFPLDGGRVVRAFWWARTGDERKGSMAAAATGRFVGWGLIAFGVGIGLLGDTVNGLMLGLTGWFLGNASRAVVRRAAVEDLLRGVTVGEVMDRNVATIAPQLTLDTFADQVVAGEGPTTLAVTRDDEILGVIGPSQVRRVRRGSWATTRAEQLMVALTDIPALDPTETVWAALDRLRRTGLDGLPVIDASGLLGMLTRAAVVRTIQSQARLHGVSVR